MTIVTSVALSSSRLSAVVGFLDTGATNASVNLYGGTRAATPANAPGTDLLVSIPLTKPCGSVFAGALTLTQLQDGLIATTGIATWARVLNGNGDTAFDCDCGQGVGAWEVQLVTTSLYAGGGAHITSAVLG